MKVFASIYPKNMRQFLFQSGKYSNKVRKKENYIGNIVLVLTSTDFQYQFTFRLDGKNEKVNAIDDTNTYERKQKVSEESS